MTVRLFLFVDGLGLMAPLTMRATWVAMLTAAAAWLVPAIALAVPVQTPPVWSAQPSTAVLEKQRTFQNGQATLSGTLYLPATGPITSALVVTHGASSPLRTSPLYDHLKQMLPPIGVAVFIYDRRGAGASGGLNKGDYDLLADDAVAAVRMLKADKRLGRLPIGVWGLSQGGWLSLLAASRSPAVDFAISISAPLVPADVQMMFSSANSLRVNGYPQAEIDQMTATRKAVDDYARGTGDQAEAQRLVDAAKIRPWFKYLYMGATIDARTVEGWRNEMSHDPMQTLRRVQVPALILYGAADPVVPVAISMERLKPIVAERCNLEAAVVARADHDMQIGVDPKTLLEPSNRDAAAPNAPEYFARLASWLTQRRLTR